MRSYTVGHVWGIPIRINISLILFLPILAYLIGSGPQIALYADLVGGLAGTEIDPAALAGVRWALGVVAAVGLFVSVLLHELGHSYVARRYGIGIESITLWIFGGIAALESIPKEWNREFWIAIAGPAVSLAIGVACLASLTVLPRQPALLFAVGWLGVINVFLTAFNLVPAFPMDGGRILRALLARRRPYASATRIAARVGTGFALLFVLVGVLVFDLILILVGLFVYGAAKSESRITTIADLLEGLTVRDLMATDAETLPAETTLAAFGDRMFETRRTSFPVEREGEIVGVVSLDALKKATRADRETTTVAEIMHESAVRVGADEEAFEALVAMNRARAAYALVESDGAVVGLVTTEDFGHTLQFAATAGRPAAESPLERGIV